MTLEINDFVMCKDEDIEGTIVSIDKNTAIVMTTDGFELPFEISSLIKVENKSLLKHVKVTSDVLKVKSSNKVPKKAVKQNKKELFTIEVDLHIEKLVTSKKGLSNIDILNIQIDTAQKSIEQAIRNNTPKLVLIHGIGEGVLKSELEYLYRKYPKVRVQEANFQKYGEGATELYFVQSTRN